MPRKYVYTDQKSGKQLFETIVANYVSSEDVDKQMFEKTKRDPRLDPFIERKITVVGETEVKQGGRFDKNKKTKGFV